MKKRIGCEAKIRAPINGRCLICHRVYLIIQFKAARNKEAQDRLARELGKTNCRRYNEDTQNNQ